MCSNDLIRMMFTVDLHGNCGFDSRREQVIGPIFNFGKKISFWYHLVHQVKLRIQALIHIWIFPEAELSFKFASIA